MKKIGWFTTARGPGSLNLYQTMIDRLDSGDIKAELAFIFINRDIKGNAYRTEMVNSAHSRGIPIIILPSDNFEPELKKKDMVAWRDQYGAKLREQIAPYQMDFGVLAGYMLIFDDITCTKYPLINLHPALPDTYKGTWMEIVDQVIDNQDECYGSMVHICSPELDRGDTIAYDSFPVSAVIGEGSREEQIERVRAEESRREAPLLMETIKMLVNEEVTLKDGHLYDAQGARMKKYPCLADRINSKTN